MPMYKNAEAVASGTFEDLFNASGESLDAIRGVTLRCDTGASNPATFRWTFASGRTSQVTLAAGATISLNGINSLGHPTITRIEAAGSGGASAVSFWTTMD